jgi:Uma2 family endonuclease
MPPTLAPLKLTYEDLLHFPEDGRRHEIVDGEHVVTPAPASRHQFIVSALLSLLWQYARDYDLGRVAGAPFDVVLSETDVVQPDVFFLAKEHEEKVRSAHIDGAPDLVVEVLSESTRRRDELTKRHLYEIHGVGEYWIVDPELELIKVYRREGERFGGKTELSAEAGDVLTSPRLEGFRVPLADLFAWGRAL